MNTTTEWVLALFIVVTIGIFAGHPIAERIWNSNLGKKTKSAFYVGFVVTFSLALAFGVNWAFGL